MCNGSYPPGNMEPGSSNSITHKLLQFRIANLNTPLEGRNLIKMVINIGQDVITAAHVV